MTTSTGTKTQSNVSDKSNYPIKSINGGGVNPTQNGSNKSNPTGSTTHRNNLNNSNTNNNNNSNNPSGTSNPVPFYGSRSLIISDLTWWTTDHDLMLVAESAGIPNEVIEKEITFQEHKMNGRSKGVAYMEFKTSEAAKIMKEHLSQM